jgi:hypothetical protein
LDLFSSSFVASLGTPICHQTLARLFGFVALEHSVERALSVYNFNQRFADALSLETK